MKHMRNKNRAQRSYSRPWTAIAVLSVSMVPLVTGQITAAKAQSPEISISEINRVIFRKFQTPDPDFQAVSALRDRIVQMTANRLADEDSLRHFYATLGVLTQTREGYGHTLRWRNEEPDSSIPILAPLSSKMSDQTGDLARVLWSRQSWHPTTDMLKSVTDIQASLLQNKAIASRDPHWYALMAQTMVALKDDRAKIASLVEEGIAKNPSNYDLVVMATNNFLSKWSGDAEALEKWARTVDDRSSARDGHAMYARIYWQAFQAQYHVHLFRLSHLDWGRLMQGLRDLISQHPSRTHLNQALLLGCLGGNKQLTKDVLLHPQFLLDTEPWSGGLYLESYQLCRNWAATN
jgi:hypothetical protein